MIEPVALASLTSAVTVLGNEFLKGIGGEAGKATWAKVKSLFGWQADPKTEEIPVKVATALTDSPELVEQLLELLKKQETGAPSAMVQNIHADNGGKVVVVQNMTGNMSF